jgi:hypothetical protein
LWDGMLREWTGYNMPMAQSKAESFTAYLEAKQRWERQKHTPGGGTAFSILTALADSAEHPMLWPALQAAVGMSFATFAGAVKRLLESGYITLTGAPGSEVARLTVLGADVADLARRA